MRIFVKQDRFLELNYNLLKGCKDYVEVPCYSSWQKYIKKFPGCENLLTSEVKRVELRQEKQIIHICCSYQKYPVLVTSVSITKKPKGICFYRLELEYKE